MQNFSTIGPAVTEKQQADFFFFDILRAARATVGTGTIPTYPKVQFLLGFRLLYFENVGKIPQEMHVSRKKNLLKYPNFWGVDPRVFSKVRGS